jgi:NitT/TauT family transport system substrate-binding protein
MVGLMQKTIVLGRNEPDAAIDSLLKRAPTLNRAVVTQVLKLSFNLIETEATKGRPIGWMSPEIMTKSQDILAQYGQIKTKQPIEVYYTNEFVPAN